MSKELKESIRKKSHQIEITNKKKILLREPNRNSQVWV